MSSKFVLFSSNPSLNQKCFILFATNTNIFPLLFKELKTDGKSFIFAVCRKTCTVHGLGVSVLSITVLRSMSCQKFYKAKLKIFKESVFHRLVNLFTVIFLCLIVRPWDCPKNRETLELWWLLNLDKKVRRIEQGRKRRGLHGYSSTYTIRKLRSETISIAASSLTIAASLKKSALAPRVQ